MSWHREDWQAFADRSRAFFVAHPTLCGVAAAFLAGVVVGLIL